MAIPAWHEKYVGASWLSHGRNQAGVDCYGLLYLVYRNELGVELPSYAAEYPDALEMDLTEKIIAREARSLWQQVPWDDRQTFDALLFRVQGHPVHIAIYLGEDYFLHVREGVNSCVEHITKWKGSLIAVYRYRNTEGEQACQ